MKNLTVIVTYAAVSGENGTPDDRVTEVLGRRYKTVTQEAFHRAARKLALARLDMDELSFLGVMEAIRVERCEGQQEIVMDGYLWEGSRKRKCRPGVHGFLFGYVENGQDVVRYGVIFKEKRIAKLYRYRNGGLPPAQGPAAAGPRESISQEFLLLPRLGSLA